MKVDWKIKTAIVLVVLIAAGVYGYQYYQGQQKAKKAAAVETIIAEEGTNEQPNIYNFS